MVTRLLNRLLGHSAPRQIHTEMLEREGKNFRQSLAEFKATPSSQIAGSIYNAASNLLVVAETISGRSPIRAVGVCLLVMNRLEKASHSDARLHDRHDAALRQAIKLLPKAMKADAKKGQKALDFIQPHCPPHSVRWYQLNSALNLMEAAPVQPAFANA